MPAARSLRALTPRRARIGVTGRVRPRPACSATRPGRPTGSGDVAGEASAAAWSCSRASAAPSSAAIGTAAGESARPAPAAGPAESRYPHSPPRRGSGLGGTRPSGSIRPRKFDDLVELDPQQLGDAIGRIAQLGQPATPAGGPPADLPGGPAAGPGRRATRCDRGPGNRVRRIADADGVADLAKLRPLGPERRIVATISGVTSQSVRPMPRARASATAASSQSSTAATSARGSPRAESHRHQWIRS